MDRMNFVCNPMLDERLISGGSDPMGQLMRRGIDWAADWRGRMAAVMVEPERGAATAEYAVVLVAATGFAALLVALLKSGTVQSLLEGIVQRALTIS